MTTFQILSLLLFLFPLAYSPGPGNIAFAAASSSHGIKSTYRANFSYHFFAIFVTLFIGFYFNKLVSNDLVLNSIGFIGSLYIMYLSSKFLKAGINNINLESTKLSFQDGVLILILNPKAYLIIFLMFTQFKANENQDSLIFLFVITAVFIINNVIGFLVYSFLAHKLTKLINDVEKQKYINLFFGSILFLVACLLLIQNITEIINLTTIV